MGVSAQRRLLGPGDMALTRFVLVLDVFLLALGGFAFLVALILWFDNAQGLLTGNGVFKTLTVAVDRGSRERAPAYSSNYLLYPLYGAGCRLLDALGVMAGDPRRQLTLLNAASAALSLGVVYLLARALGSLLCPGSTTALFHIACSVVLMLAITNEDIMPSFTVVLAAMALGAIWFAAPTAPRVLVVAVVFSIGWLLEWRLIFLGPARVPGRSLPFRRHRCGTVALSRVVPGRHRRDRGIGVVAVAGSQRRGRAVRPAVDRQGRQLGVAEAWCS